MPFVDIQGKNTYYRQNGEILADRTSVIFVHGAGGTGKNWAYQLAGIAGYNLIALDLPGHGRSEGPTNDVIQGYSEFIWSFAQALGLGQFVIAGHSMGGAIAMELALTYPKPIKGLIIVDSGARLRVNPYTFEVLSKGEHPIENIKNTYSEKVPEMVLKEAAEEMKTIPTGVFLADFRACNGFNIMDRIKEINQPTLVICGEDDQMTPVKYSKYLDAELGQSTLSIIKNAGHMAMLEKPDSVNQVMQVFLDGLR